MNKGRNRRDVLTNCKETELSCSCLGGLCLGVWQCWQWVTHLESFASVAARVAAWLCASSCHFGIRLRRSTRSAAKYQTLVSNQIIVGDAMWLNCGLCLPRPLEDPLQRGDWQHGDWSLSSLSFLFDCGDISLLKFTKSLAMCIMHGSFFIWLF